MFLFSLRRKKNYSKPHCQVTNLTSLFAISNPVTSPVSSNCTDYKGMHIFSLSLNVFTIESTLILPRSVSAW